MTAPLGRSRIHLPFRVVAVAPHSDVAYRGRIARESLGIGPPISICIIVLVPKPRSRRPLIYKSIAVIVQLIADLKPPGMGQRLRVIAVSACRDVPAGWSAAGSHEGILCPIAIAVCIQKPDAGVLRGLRIRVTITVVVDAITPLGCPRMNGVI